MAWFVYMLRCGDGSLYTGCTDNMERRLAAHQRGKGGKYTRSHLPVELIYREEAVDKSAALRREAEIKRLNRSGKLALLKEVHFISDGQPLIDSEVTTETRGMTEMRRKDRQISEVEAWQVVDSCDYAVLSMIAENGEPYAVPLSVARIGEQIYFHCAAEGRKTDSLRKNPRVCLICVGKTQAEQAKFTMRYESAIVFGTAEELTREEDKREGLRCICERYAPEQMEHFDAALAADMNRTAVWKIIVETITGKANR